MRAYYSDTFLKNASKLDDKQRAKLARLIVLLRENPFHSQLHTKRLSGDFASLYSFRITRDWRAIFKVLSHDELMLTNVGHRKDIYR